MYFFSFIVDNITATKASDFDSIASANFDKDIYKKYDSNE